MEEIALYSILEIWRTKKALEQAKESYESSIVTIIFSSLGLYSSSYRPTV